MSAATYVITDELARARLIQALKRMEIDPLRPAVLRLVPFERHARLRLKGYYRGVVLKALCEFTGYEEHEMHRLLIEGFGERAKYWAGDDWASIENEDFDDQKTWVAFLDMVVRWASSSLDCYIPSPRQAGIA